MSKVRDMNLWQALVWVYRDQKAHLYLKTPSDWFIWALAIDELVEDMPRATVDPDAAQLHAAVCNLTQDQARLIVHFALEQRQPECPTQMPAPYPVRVHHGIGLGDGERWGQMATARGGRLSYLIRWLEQVAFIEPIMKRYGKRLRQIGQRTTQHPVEFCPIEWQPSLAFVVMLADTHRRWVEAIRRLYADLACETWQSIAIGSDGIENEHIVDVADMAEGLSRARADGWLRDVDLDQRTIQVTDYRGIDATSGNAQVHFLTRKMRTRARPKRDSAAGSRPGTPPFSAS
jgi:hypothetical protein